MSPAFRERLYGIFAWAAVLVAVALVGVGSASGLDLEIPAGVGKGLAVAQAVIGTLWGWLGFVAKSNVPATDVYDEPTDPDLEGVG